MVRLMRRIFDAVRQQQYIGKISILVVGVVLAQTINLATTPILSRTYNVEDFGTYALFLSMGGILTSILTLRYDQAVIIAKSDHEAVLLMLVGVVSVTILGLGLTSCAFVVSSNLSQRLFGMNVPSFVAMVGLYSLANSAVQLGVAWSIRKKAFRSTAAVDGARAFACALTQISLGRVLGGASSLMWGIVLAEFVALGTIFGANAAQGNIPASPRVTMGILIKVAREYRDFPCFAAPQSLLTSATQGVPAMILIGSFGPIMVGSFSLSVRLLQAPFNLMMGPIRQVYLQSISVKDLRSESAVAEFKSITGALILVAVFATMAVGIASQIGFSWLLGNRWGDVDKFAPWLMMWLSAVLVSLPATVVMQILRMQRQRLMIDLLQFVIRSGFLLLCASLVGELMTVAVFSLIGMAFAMSLTMCVWFLLSKQTISKQ
jgi:lipopolysaccharide exporter